ncbi:MAG: GreA/GreB family elongation factor [Nitrosomonadales bacterium]|nr:GreA/GreB family elongation factor [Nitrosomonadales bacterium]
MSRGFVKEDDLEHAGTDLPERPVSDHPNYVTPFGLKQLEAETARLEKLRSELSPQKEDPIKQQQLGMVERDLRYFQARLEQAILVEAPKLDNDKVVFGTTVHMEDEDGVLTTFTIVGEDEADIAAHKVSWISPLAKALLGHKVGDSVVWRRPAGDMNLEITDID